MNSNNPLVTYKHNFVLDRKILLIDNVDFFSIKETDKEKFVDEKLSILEKSLEEAIKQREEMEKIITQNEKTYKILENIEKDSYKIKSSLRRVESQFEIKPVEQKRSFWKKCLPLKN